MKMTNIKRLAALLLAVALLGSVLSGCTGKPADVPTEANQETVPQAAEEPAVEEVKNWWDKIYDPAAGEGKFSAYFINGVKEFVTYSSVTHSGDSTLLVAPDGTTMLVDTNTAANGSEIVAALQGLGITSLDYLLFSHPHADHIGSTETVLRYIDVKHVYMNGHDYSANSSMYVNLIQKFEEENIDITILKEGDVFTFGKDVEVTVMNPPADYEFNEETAVSNSGSLLLRFVYGESSFLFGGDIYVAHEKTLVEKYGDALKTDVVKMNHHGYESSNSRDWAQAVDAKIAVGPAHAVISDTVEGRYRVTGAVTMYSGIDGTICVRTTGDGTYEVQVEYERFMDDYGLLTEEKDYKDGYFIVE